MRRPHPPLALEVPAIEVDDVFIARLAGLARASTPAVRVRPATLRIAAAAASVAVIAGGGAYAADRLTGPAPHHVPPAGRPTTDGPSPDGPGDEDAPAAPGASTGSDHRGTGDQGNQGHDTSGPGSAPAGIPGTDDTAPEDETDEQGAAHEHGDAGSGDGDQGGGSDHSGPGNGGHDGDHQSGNQDQAQGDHGNGVTGADDQNDESDPTPSAPAQGD